MNYIQYLTLSHKNKQLYKDAKNIQLRLEAEAKIPESEMTEGEYYNVGLLSDLNISYQFGQKPPCENKIISPFGVKDVFLSTNKVRGITVEMTETIFGETEFYTNFFPISKRYKNDQLCTVLDFITELIQGLDKNYAVSFNREAMLFYSRTSMMYLPITNFFLYDDDKKVVGSIQIEIKHNLC